MKFPFLLALQCSLLIACSKTPTTSTTNSNVTPTSGLTLTNKGRSAQRKVLNDERVNESDFQGISSTELRLIRNTVFARHGRKYDKNPELQSYFDTCSWYKPRDEYSDAELTQADRDNVKTILALEKPAASPSGTSDTAQQSGTNPVPQTNPTDISGGSMEEQALRAERQLFDLFYINAAIPTLIFKRCQIVRVYLRSGRAPLASLLKTLTDREIRDLNGAAL